jgi:flagellar hook assembly protein FlgD
MTETPSASETATATSAVSNPTETSTPTPAATIAVRVLLDRNYINTGNGDTVLIRYKAAKDGDCWIDIYNLNGELVKKFPRVSLKAGENSAVWDGSNNNGQKVGQGIYFIVVHQPGGTATSKLVVIK